ncbi:MAG: M48 family metallopeptidase [Methylohalobius sp. ZOD2]
MVRKRLLALSLMILLTACATSPTGRSQLMLMPEGQLTQMGFEAFEQIKNKEQIETAPEINAYVQCVVRELTRDLSGQWEVVVFKSDQANAFALPGGKIGVYSGLLKVAKNQHQLASVVGHEIGHVQARHSNERVSQEFAVSQSLALIQAIAAPQSATGQLVMGALGVGAQYGVLMPFSRIQESEADTIGLELMARAGFDPREAVQLWYNMEAAGGARPPEWLSTHPSHDTRIQDLQARMDKALALYQTARSQGRAPNCTY